MYYSKAWVFIILIVIVGGFSAAFQHLRRIDELNAGILQSRQVLVQTKKGLEQQRADWDNVDVLIRQQWEVQRRIPVAEQRKKELETRFRELEGQLSHLVSSSESAVERVRREAIGETSEELLLTDGRVLRQAQIRSVTDAYVSFIHADGVGTIQYDRLSQDWQKRFDQGTETWIQRLKAARLELLERVGP